MNSVKVTNPKKPMPAKKKEEEDNTNHSQDQLMSLLKGSKTDHYNFEDSIIYKVPSSSLLLTSLMDGGLGPGCHRFLGGASNGKTSAALDFLLNFLKESTEEEPRRGVYFKSEGRLSEDMKTRSGVTFVTSPKDWFPGTAIIIDSNVFEFVFDIIREQITKNPTKCRYFYILDSLDMMAKRIDLERPLADATSVAGGALLSSVFLKKVSIGLNKRGHIAIFISQVRESIKINPYEKTPPKVGNASGGHAMEHAADWVIEFLGRNASDIIRMGDEAKGKPIGHYAKAKIIKANNESYNQEVKYPICYKRTNGQSIWREKEVIDMLLAWTLVVRAGAWYKPEENFLQEVRDKGFDMADKYQGLENLSNYLNVNPSLIDYLFDKFMGIVEISQ